MAHQTATISSVGRRSARSLLWISRGLLISLVLVFVGLRAAGISLSLTAQSIIYLLGMVALNLPHGGFEHANNLWQRSTDFVTRYLTLFLLGVALFISLLFWNPALGLGLALVVAMVKGGHGGLQVLDATYSAREYYSRFRWLLAGFVRGGAVMLVPMVAWPSTFYMFSQYMANIFQMGALTAAGSHLETVRLGIGILYGSALVLHLGLGYLAQGGATVWQVEALETLLLATYFTVVPVVVAVGLYFPAWYSIRQMARATATKDDAFAASIARSDDPPLVAGLRTWGTFIVGAAATFALMGALYLYVPNPLGGAAFWPGLVAFFSIFVSIIALPHIVVGAWLDRDRGIWYVP